MAVPMNKTVIHPNSLLKTCLFVMPFSVMVSFIDTTVAGKMYACCSMDGNGGASNDVQTVLFACVFPSYSSIVAKIHKLPSNQ